eukprot:TRINITY_DN464_c1_g1_i1.p1 TRINITY_DN464_c1_g1~~TRINITY_DN464_c1_g1_i1.p1  ORF type:complete len:677 (+),score=194.20 TRINITY_DN464_c1_g1_i1:101-2131(+)
MSEAERPEDGATSPTSSSSSSSSSASSPSSRTPTPSSPTPVTSPTTPSPSPSPSSSSSSSAPQPQPDPVITTSRTPTSSPSPSPPPTPPPSSPTPTSSPSPSSAPETAPVSASSSWSSWGWGLVADVTESVAQVNQRVISPALSSVSEATAHFVSDMAESIDVDPSERERKPLQLYPDDALSPERKHGDQKEGDDSASGGGDPNSTGDTAGAEKRGDGDSGEDSEEEDDDPLIQYVDSGVELVGSGIESLAGMIGSGVSNLRTKNMEELVDMSSHFAASSLSSIEKVGSSAIGSLRAELEGIVGDQYGVPDDFDEIEPVLEVKGNSFEECFTHSSGTSILAQSQSVSMECMMESQKIFGALDMEKRELVSVQMSGLRDVFKQDDTDVLQLPAIGLSQYLLEKQTQLSARFEEAKQSNIPLRKKFQEALANAKYNEGAMSELSLEEKSAKRLYHAQALFQLALETQEEIRRTCMYELALCCTLVVSHVYSIIDFLMEHQAHKSIEDVKRQALYLKLVCEEFEEELGVVSNGYIVSLKGVFNATITGLKETGSDEEVQTLTRALTTKINTSRNNIYIDVGTAVSKVKEAKKGVMSVTKFFLMNCFSLDGPRPLPRSNFAPPQVPLTPVKGSSPVPQSPAPSSARTPAATPTPVTPVIPATPASPSPAARSPSPSPADS